MARVNHKLVRRLMDEKRSKISDRQFFTSRVLALHFEDMAVAQTRRYRYNRRVRVRLSWEPKRSEVACTDNHTIRINTGNEMVTQNRTRAERYEVVSGLFAHELGHCLFTDFLSAQTHSNHLASHIWYPEKPKLTRVEDIRNEQALWDFIKAHPEHMTALVRISQYIANVLEDGYIENRMLAQFPGVLGQNLSILREQQWEAVPTVTQLKERESEGDHILQSVLQLLLSYVKYGELKYGEEPLSDGRIQLVFGLLPELDRAVVTTSAHERLSVVNLVLIRCWEYIRDFIETHGDEEVSDEAVSKALEAIEGGSEAGTGDETPVEGGEAVPLMTGMARAGTMSDADMTADKDDSQTETDDSAACEAPERLPYEITDRISVPEGGGRRARRRLRAGAQR